MLLYNPDFTVKLILQTLNSFVNLREKKIIKSNLKTTKNHQTDKNVFANAHEQISRH